MSTGGKPVNDLRDEALKQAREKLKESAERDRLMVKAVNLYDELGNNVSKEMERFRDWYSLYFPELEEEISEDEHLVKILSKTVERDRVAGFEELAESSTGMTLTDKDIEVLEESLNVIEKKRSHRENLEKYIEQVAEEEMSNLSTVLGPLLAARIVALAGSLEDLAKKPASTVQMLGAEKALFRYLHGEGTPPKHGVIFQHRFINSLPESKRGKMARFLANKAVMAARLDQYGDKEKGEELRQECLERFEDLKN